MLTRRIIPCLDVTEGRVVKGTNFVNLRDAGDPIELAKQYNEEGADELVFLDITATSDKRKVLIDLVEKTANQIFIPFTVGGGISNIQTIRKILAAGADKISINTAAVKKPSLVTTASRQFGNQCIVVAIDARKINNEIEKVESPYPELKITEKSQFEIYTHGGRKRTGIDAVKWAIYMEECGAGELLITSMDKDGTKSGYDLPMLKAITEKVRIPVIASGGAGTCEHITEALEICNAALLASLLHFKEATVDEIKENCRSKNLPIRKT